MKLKNKAIVICNFNSTVIFQLKWESLVDKQL